MPVPRAPLSLSIPVLAALAVLPAQALPKDPETSVGRLPSGEDFKAGEVLVRERPGRTGTVPARPALSSGIRVLAGSGAGDKEPISAGEAGDECKPLPMPDDGMDVGDDRPIPGSRPLAGGAQASPPAPLERPAPGPAPNTVLGLFPDSRWLVAKDFSRTPLLDGIVFVPGANLRGADFTGKILAGARLGNADCTGARFHGVDLSGADLGSATFTGAEFQGAILKAGDFLRLRAQGNPLRGAVMLEPSAEPGPGGASAVAADDSVMAHQDPPGPDVPAGPAPKKRARQDQTR